jgi:nucleoside-diphosphate-sugar epimerase
MESLKNFVQGCRSVIHLAGIAHTDLRSKTDSERAYAVNVNGTKNLLKACSEGSVKKIIILSSAHVYKGQRGLDLTEDCQTSPDSVYSKMKLEIESLSAKSIQHGINAVIVRPCLTYGPNVSYNLSRLMRGISRGYYFHIDGFNPLRSMLSVENAANALVHLVEAGESGCVYNLADRDPVGLVDFVNDIADRLRVSRPRSIPLWLARAGLFPFDVLQNLGVRSGISSGALEKLTQPFSLNISRLASTGFQWSDSRGTILQEMSDTYLGNNR